MIGDPRARPPDRRRAARQAAADSTSSASCCRPPASGSRSSACCGRASGAGCAEAGRAGALRASPRCCGCILGGLFLIWLFFVWETTARAPRRRAARPPVDARATASCSAGCGCSSSSSSCRPGVFFTVPLFLSVSLGLSAIDTGVRILPLSVALLRRGRRGSRASARTSPAPRGALRPPGDARRARSCCSPASTPRRRPRSSPCRCCSLGLGIGALASQLGAVTVSAVPDDQSAEVGGLQNTATNIGASLGTALAGSVLIAA